MTRIAAAKKDDRVEVVFKGGSAPGVVRKVAGDGRVIVEMDDGRVTPLIAQGHLRHSDAPLPEHLARTWAKRDRVEFDMEGAVAHGTVDKVGIDLVVVLDGALGRCAVPRRMARPSTKVLEPEKPGPMTPWGIQGYKVAAGLSQETTAYTATITLDGRPAIRASNAGQGGCDRYEGPREIVDRFHADAAAWLKEAGSDFLSEPESVWIDWHVNFRPYACDAKEYVERIEIAMSPAVHSPAYP